MSEEFLYKTNRNQMHMRQRSLRVALFCSGMAGYSMAKALSNAPYANQLEFVGICTDDEDRFRQTRRVTSTFTDHERQLVPQFARQSQLPLRWASQVKSDEFAREFQRWQADVVFVYVFGRLIPQRIIDSTPLVLNHHPGYRDEWPSCQGADCYQQIVNSGTTEFTHHLHRIVDDHGFDTGPEVDQTSPIPICNGMTQRELYLLSIKPSTDVVVTQCEKLLQAL